MEIWVVSKEYYDDYEILAVFNSYKKADKFVNAIRKPVGKQPEINMYTLNPYLKEVKEGKHFYCVKEKKGEFIVKLSNDFSTPLNHNGYKVYKCWAKTPEEALDCVKKGELDERWK